MRNHKNTSFTLIELLVGRGQGGHARGSEARQALLYLAATFCRGRYNLAELGQRLGPITTAAVSRARSIMAGRMARDRELRGRIAKMEDRLRRDKCKV